jgi:hypothetical protein
MIGDAGTTTEELREAWRAAESAVRGSDPGTPEHAEAIRREDAAHAAYQARIDALKADLRDG